MTVPPDCDTNFTMAVSEETAITVNTIVEDSYNSTMVDLFMERVAMTLYVYYTPFLIFLGCIGNIICITVFFKSKLRLQSTSQYLTALALTDTIFLCQLLPPWLKAVGASTLFSRHGYCQLFVYLSYVTCMLSSWLVVAFTVERFVAVVYPLRRNIMCTVKRARLIIASLAVIALLVNLPVPWFVVPSANDCNIDELLMVHAARFNLFDTAIAFTLPLALIIILNTWITWGMYRMKRAQPNLVSEQRAGLADMPVPVRGSTCQRCQQRVTKMLLIVSSVFVLLNLPAYTMRIVAYANNMDEREYIGKWAALQQICLLFFNTNFGINFVLYCMTGQNFRFALVEMFSWLRRQEEEAIELQEIVQDRPARASSMSTSFSTNYTDATPSHAIQYGVTNTTHQRGGTGQAGGEQNVEGREYTRRNWSGQMEILTIPRRGRNEEIVIRRWKFDNTRQQRRESVEMMEELPAGNI